VQTAVGSSFDNPYTHPRLLRGVGKSQLILVCNEDAAHKFLHFISLAFWLTLVFIALKML